MRGRRVAIGLAVLFSTAGAAWGAARWHSAVELREAQREMASGRFDAAKRRLLALAQWNPVGRVERDYSLGICELALGHAEAAQAALKRVPPSSEFAARAAVLQARVVLARHRFAEAEPLLQSALEDPTPAGTEARATLAHIWKIQGRFGEVAQLLSAGRERTPDLPALLAEYWRLTRDPYPINEFRDTLERASRAAPDDDRIWLGQANLATHSLALDEADHWLRRCEERRPSDPAVGRARLDWAIAADDSAAARAALARLPGDALSPREVFERAAWFAQQEGRAGDEDRALERLLALEPANAHALERLAELAAAGGRPARAEELRSRKAEVDKLVNRYQYLAAFTKPGDSAAELAELAEKLGWQFEARAWWSIAERANPRVATARARRARLVQLHEQAPPPGGTVLDLLAEIGPASARAQPKGPSPSDAPGFTDDAEAAGLVFTFDNGRTRLCQLPETMSGGVGLIDFDGDGWLDVFVLQGGAFPPDSNADPAGDRLFRNRRDGTFEDVSRSVLPTGTGGYGHGVAVGDYDNDGHADIFITRWRSYALYRNRGDGRFEDVTQAAGLDGDRDWPTSCAWADIDNDGDLDLYVCHYVRWDAEHPTVCRSPASQAPIYCSPATLEPAPDHLFRNEGGRFVDVTEKAGIVDLDGRGLGVVAADLDGDGKIDLFVANDLSPNHFFHNLGGFRFEDRALESGLASNGEGGYQAGMGIACGDLDGDGLTDLVVTNFYGESATYYHNLGAGLFADHTKAAGLAAPTRYTLGFGASFLDANRDGRLDLLIANGHVNDSRPQSPYAMPTQLLLGARGGRLVDVTQQAGPAFTTPRVGRGLAVGDLDNDGKTDALVLPQNSPLVYLHNRAEGGHFVTLALEATGSNREAIGARVRIAAGGRTMVADRFGGGSYQSASDPRLYFGLGAATKVESLRVTWPSGKVDTFANLPADTGYLVREGQASPSPLAGFEKRVSTRP